VFIVALMLFLLPCSLLWLAWTRSRRTSAETQIPKWRDYCGKTALVLAVCSSLLELVFFFSWFHNGGSPHGMMPAPGIWKFAGRISFGVLVVSVFLSAFGKGGWRLFVPAWAASYLLVAYVVFMLERD